MIAGGGDQRDVGCWPFSDLMRCTQVGRSVSGRFEPTGLLREPWSSIGSAVRLECFHGSLRVCDWQGSRARCRSSVVERPPGVSFGKALIGPLTTAEAVANEDKRD
jgi:hypothetical protein